MSLSEAAIARFLRGLSTTRPALVSVRIARGFQRGDRRELAGFLDGLRNTTAEDRVRVVFVNRDEAPDEPDWLELDTWQLVQRAERLRARVARDGLSNREGRPGAR